MIYTQAPTKNDNDATKDAPPCKHTDGALANDFTVSAGGEELAAEDFAKDIGKGIMKSGNALARSKFLIGTK